MMCVLNRNIHFDLLFFIQGHACDCEWLFTRKEWCLFLAFLYERSNTYTLERRVCNYIICLEPLKHDKFPRISILSFISFSLCDLLLSSPIFKESPLLWFAERIQNVTTSTNAEPSYCTVWNLRRVGAKKPLFVFLRIF